MSSSDGWLVYLEETLRTRESGLGLVVIFENEGARATPDITLLRLASARWQALVHRPAAPSDEAPVAVALHCHWCLIDERAEGGRPWTTTYLGYTGVQGEGTKVHWHLVQFVGRCPPMMLREEIDATPWMSLPAFEGALRSRTLDGDPRQAWSMARKKLRGR